MSIYTSITEAFGLAIAKAMAYGIPVVAYKRSAMPKVISNAGCLVDSVEEFTEKLLNMLNDKKLEEIYWIRRYYKSYESSY